jgi:Tol biopolymer transport system component
MRIAILTAIATALSGCAFTSGVLGQSGVIRVTYYAPAWGPNEKGEEVVYFLKQVSFESDRDAEDRIYFCSVKPDGTDRQEIAQLWKDEGQSFENYANAVTMEVNPATKRAAIGVAWGERGGIFVVGLDGKELKRVWPKAWEQERPDGAGYPTWSPDGQWIAFEEKRTSKGGGYDYRQIVKCRPDGTGYIRLTERDGYKINIQPAWSPTTNVIAYVHHPNGYPGQRYLWLMDGDGNHKRDTKIWGDFPRWSPDGNEILFSEGILVNPVSGEKLRILKPHPKMFAKWGKTGYVFVGPLHIGVIDLGVTKATPILNNLSRKAGLRDLEKEEFRW